MHQELRAREPIRRVLVVCPAGLREKWKAELRNRFDEQFQIMRRHDSRAGPPSCTATRTDSSR